MEKERIANGGVQYVPQIAVQYVYLDFDGELTDYNGEILTIEGVEVKDSSLTKERIAHIVAELNAKYASQNVIFVTDRPTIAEYSTIFIGKTDAFSSYGNFAGLAETIDEGNRISTDNAFVMLDSTSTNAEIISTISHETDHLLGTLSHGGDGLDAYAFDIDYDYLYNSSCGCCKHVFYNHVFSGNKSGIIRIGGTIRRIRGLCNINDYHEPKEEFYYFGYIASDVTICSGTIMHISSGGTASNTIIDHSGHMFVLSNGIANDTTVNSRGYMYIYSDGVANSTTVGGYIHISSGGVANSTTVNDGTMFISSGGVANSATVNSGGYIRISSGGTAAGIIENGGFVYVDGGANVTFVSNTFSGLNLSSGTVHFGTTALDTVIVSGPFHIFSGGIACDTTIVSGLLYIYSGGIACDTTVNSNGRIYLSGGIHSGVLNIKSGGIVSAYAGSIVSLDLSERSAESPAVINDITRIFGTPDFTVNMDSDLSKGKYKLAGNAANFHKNITLTIDGNNVGVFQWNNGVYNSVKVGNDYYTLVLDQESNLCLQSVPCISIDYSIDEIDQIVYYHGPLENEFSGAVMKVPYTATAMITLDKDTPDGEYEFVTVLDGIDGAEQSFQIQVIDGMPVYLSSNACYYGTKLSETEEDSTWSINVNDFVLTEKIQKTVTVTPKYEGDGSLILTGAIVSSVLFLSACSGAESKFIDKGESDANKAGYYISLDDSLQHVQKNKDDEVISTHNHKISIQPIDKNDDGLFDEYEYTVDSKKYTESIEAYPDKIKTILLQLNDKDCKFGVDELKISVTATDFEERQKNHCWIATTANMLYKGGYLKDDETAQECFDYLSKYFYQKDGTSTTASFERVMKLFPEIKAEKYNVDDKVDAQLDSLTGDTNRIGYISLCGYDLKDHTERPDQAGHALTCYSVYNVSPNKKEIRIADSDQDINTPTVTPYTLKISNDICYIENYYKNICGIHNCKENHDARIRKIYTLLANNDNEPIQIDYKSMKLKEAAENVLARDYDNLSKDGALVLICSFIEDAVVEADGVLEIADGATGDTINLHDKAVLNLKSGAFVRGEIMTHGGTISTESGVLFEEAEINFVISMLDGKGEAMLDNLDNVSDIPLNITVMAHQAEGEYVLAGGADGFTREVTIHGEYGDSNQLKMGFEVGELGTLRAGEELKIGDQVYSLDIENNQLIFRVSDAPLTVWDISANITSLTESVVTVCAVFSDDITRKEYSLDGCTWKNYSGGVEVASNGTIYFRGADSNGNYSEIACYDVDNIIERYNGGSVNGVSMPTEHQKYLVEYSKDNFENYLQLQTNSNQLNTYGLSEGCYNWQFWASDTCEWWLGNDIVVAEKTSSATIWESLANGNTDVFFADAQETWGKFYSAEHRGLLNGWKGTKERVAITGKNKIADVFKGSSDANVLVLTDDANGDALFVDDIYTSFGKDAARIAQIDEIRAGAGADIVDLTSQKFAYVGEGVKVYGGLGSDTIWANKGKNILFGDAGNDRIVGASDNDVIIGGIGNDSMHGGGGEDIFTFGGNWGKDTITQLVDGKVTLWFEDGDKSKWNASTLTYTDGTNSVKVTGIASDKISLKFGGDTSELPDGAFAEAASEKIFEDKNKGMLA